MGFNEEYQKLRNERMANYVPYSPSSSSGGSSGGISVFSEEYNALRNKRLSTPSPKTDIAPVSTRVTTRMTVKSEEDEEEEKKKEEERTWFKKGDESIAKTILGTGADLLEDITAGILGIGEKVVDAGAMLAPYAANASLHMDGFTTPEVEKAYKDLQEDAKREIGEFVQKDLYDETAVARKIISGVGSASYLDSKIQSGYVTTEDLKFAQELNEPVLDYMENDMEEDSVLGKKADALVQSAGQLAGQYGLSMVGVPWFVTSGVSSFGSEAENALKNGASHEEAIGSGLVSAGAEILAEKLFGGDLFVGKSGSDLATKYLASSIANKGLRTLLKWGLNTVGEGSEEIVSQFFSNLGTALYREENLGEILFSEQAMDEYLESFIGGVGLGGVMDGINVATSTASGVDYASGLTVNEQKVVQKELENRLADKGGKLTAKQKADIYDEVVRDMEKGRISTDTIEEVLGGEAFDKYNAAMNNKKDNDFLASYDALRKKQNPTTEDVASLMKMEPMHKSITDYRNQTKAELSKKVSEFVINDRLSESYRESDRRFQKYEADVTKYDEKQREIVQKAIDSGVLNNTNRSHEFVDVIAKISAEKGVPFDFTNNAKLKESGFAVEGATVDGFVNENGITINMQSPKAWQTTVGHEVTHVLEGTEFYSELQNVLFEYAKPKGDYKARYDVLAERYKEVYKDSTPEEYEAKINSEVTADLIGEYLFTDENFVNNLTANRNVFQKIYDEIKYLAKIVTAGSKEARDIERIKKAFDKAYKEATWEKTDTKYSISEGKVLYTGSPNTDIQQFKVGGVDGSRQTGDRYGRGVYLTTNESTAKNYAGDNGRVYKINADDLSIFNLNDTITAEMQESLIRDFNSADKQFRNSMLRNFRTEKTFDDFESAEKFFDHQRTVWKEQDGEYAANKPEIKEADYKTGKAVIEFTDFENWESNIGTLTGNHLYDALKSISTDDFSSFITGHGFDGIAFDEDSNNQQYVIYRNEDRLRIDNGDVKYSLSVDSDGRKLSEGQDKFFQDSKARTDEGNLALVYHSSPTAGFTVFEGGKGKYDYKYGNYVGGVTFFTDNKTMANTYSRSDETVDTAKLETVADAQEWLNDISAGYVEIRNADGVYKVVDSDGGYEILTYQSEEDLFRNLKRDIQNELGDPNAGGQYEGYVNIKNPMVVDAWNGDWNDIIIETPYKVSSEELKGRIDSLTKDEKAVVLSIIYSDESAQDIYDRSAYEIFKDMLSNTDRYSYSEWKKNALNSAYSKMFPNGYNENELRAFFEFASSDFDSSKYSDDLVFRETVDTNEIVRRALENGSYDGVIIKRVSDYAAFQNWHSSTGTGNVYVVFNSNQFKAADNLNPTDDPDIRYSLTDKNVAPVSGSYATPASDLMYAPVVENSIVEQETQLSEENSTASETEEFAPSMPISTAEQEVAATTEPKTTAEKAQDHYRDDILNRGDILSKLVNSGKTTMKAVTDATKQAQTLISKGADGVKSIGEIFGRISTDGKLGDFEDYLHHLLNVDRRTLNDRFGIHDRPVWGYSAEESQKRADKLAEENPEFVKAAEDVYAFNDYIMRVRVQSGKITQEQADIWKQYYPHYVPISRGGNADNYSTLLKFAEGDTTGIQSLDEFAVEADRAADVHKVKAVGDDFDSLMDTMVNAAFTAHWGLAISDNVVTAPVQTEAQHTQEAPVADTTAETHTVEDYVPSAEKAPSPDAVQPADHESIKLMEQHDGVRGKLDDAVHWAEDNILDNGRVFEKIDHKKGNRNLYSHWHAIRNAFSSAQHFIGKGNSAKGVRALNDIYAEINKKGLTSDFDSYLAHQRNIDGMTMQARYGVAANREVIKGASAAQSYREVRKLETDHPEFKQWAKDIYANTGYVIDQMVEHKMLSQDMADLFKELYPHYVPVRYGKNGALESSLESMGQFTVEAFNSFAMNDFGLELKHTLRSEIDREDMNIDTFIDRLDSGASLFDFDVNGMDEDYHTFTVYEDGELKTFDITREMYMAMNQTRNWMDWKIPVLYQVNEGFRKATTELNWIFAATNGIKDPQEIMWNSQHPLETYAKFLPAEAAVWSKDSKYRHYYEEYLANGGESVEYFNPNKNEFDADKGVLSYLNQKIGTGAISKLNGRVETAPRLAEYIASREAGKSVQEAMLDAAQVTVNFQAGGKLTKFLNRNGCTFLNASVQGALQHVRNIQEGKQNAWKGVSALIAKGMVAGLGSELVKQINHLLWDDDDEYENLPDYIKQDYYLFGKFGDGTWLRLPKGRTNATIEEAIRQVALSSTGDDEADWDAFWKLFIENMAPNNPITNNLLAPILEVKSNTTWYGEDLVPSRLLVTKDENGNEIEIPAVKQFDEKTDDFSVWLGEQLDYSPKKINYLLNSYTGVIGDTFLPMMTPKAESPDDSLLGQLVAPLRDKFTTDAVLNHRATEDFYEALEEAEAKAESEDATLEDKLESGLLIGYNVELSDLYAKQREIQMDKSLKNSEKYEQTREIKQKINDLQEEALKALEGYDIDGIYAEAGDKRYNFDEENDTWWEVKPKTADGEDNWYYQQEQLYHDYLGVDYADYWNGRLNPKDYKVKSLYAEENGKRYNFDMDDNSWYEIKPKNKDGSDNYYYQQEQRITKDLGISPERYWNNRQMFDDFYYVAGGYEKDSPEDDTIETARAVFGYEEFAKYASELKNIKADRDKNGEIIKNSKYPKVKAYIDSLDIPDIEKKILYTMQYPNYKKYKGEIVKYLDQNDDISYYSFYKILDELKYKVDSNGRVTWY